MAHDRTIRIKSDGCGCLLGCLLLFAVLFMGLGAVFAVVVLSLKG